MGSRLCRLAMLTRTAGAALGVRAWRDAFLGVGEAPSVAGRMVERHAALGTGAGLGWPHGVQEDDEVRWHWDPPRPPPDA